VSEGRSSRSVRPPDGEPVTVIEEIRAQNSAIGHFTIVITWVIAASDLAACDEAPSIITTTHHRGSEAEFSHAHTARRRFSATTR